MVVTSSRLEAVRYKVAFDKYIADKGYSDKDCYKVDKSKQQTEAMNAGSAVG